MIHENRHQSVGNEQIVKLNVTNSRRSDIDTDVGGPARDISGYVVFSEGDAGSAHLAAHRMLDAGRIERGHQQLAEWLDGRTGSGSEWLHLQFHMAVFELSLGDWNSAYVRFLNEVLPAAASTQNALTDAPALLWRLALSAPESVVLPWQPLRRTALIRMRRTSEPFVELHNLLALAGAGDPGSIDQWLKTRPRDSRTESEYLVERMAVALRAYAGHNYRVAATLFRSIVPHMPKIGGSRAQNQLFEQLEAASWKRISDANLAPLYSEAA